MNESLAPIGLPFFVLLLLRSSFHYRWRRQVSWKGRTYQQDEKQVSGAGRA